MRSLIIFLFLTVVTVTQAQERTIEDILAKRELTRPRYILKTGMMGAIVLNMGFGNDNVISETDKKLLQKAQVISVDLVYTDFPKGEDLKALNTRRIKMVQSLRKDLVTNPDIAWNVIRQMDCANEAEARTMFHGFVIKYRPEQDSMVTRMDLSFFGGLPKTGDSLKKMVTKALPYGVKLTDTTVMSVLNRNKKWKEMLIVADMTGSMSPYTSQLLVWFQLKMKDNRVKGVVFFNDGDMKEEHEKKVGSIGGIYMADTMTYDHILRVAIKTTMGGCGGDGPENNCEALIKGIEKHPNANEIIMIADNMAPIKDYALISKIGKPVHVILCGTEYFPVNPEYLNLARMTGGTLHTMTQDLVDLAKLNEGAEVKIGAKSYKIVNGSFTAVTKS